MGMRQRGEYARLPVAVTIAKAIAACPAQPMIIR